MSQQCLRTTGGIYSYPPLPFSRYFLSPPVSPRHPCCLLLFPADKRRWNMRRRLRNLATTAACSGCTSGDGGAALPPSSPASLTALTTELFVNNPATCCCKPALLHSCSSRDIITQKFADAVAKILAAKVHRYLTPCMCVCVCVGGFINFLFIEFILHGTLIVSLRV